MKNQKKLLAYLIVVGTLLAGVADILLTIHGYRDAGHICGGISFLGAGIIWWANDRKVAILLFISAGLAFLTTILGVLYPAW